MSYIDQWNAKVNQIKEEKERVNQILSTLHRYLSDKFRGARYSDGSKLSFRREGNMIYVYKGWGYDYGVACSIMSDGFMVHYKYCETFGDVANAVIENAK